MLILRMLVSVQIDRMDINQVRQRPKQGGLHRVVRANAKRRWRRRRFASFGRRTHALAL